MWHKKKKKELDTSSLDKSVALSRQIHEQSSKTLSKFEDMAKQAFENTIVVIEDDPDHKKIQSDYFRNNGVKFQFAPDLNKAYRLISLVNPRLIVLDADVPDFEKMCENFSEKVVIFSGHPEGVSERLRNMVLNVFGKDHMKEMVQFIKEECGENIDKQGQII